MYFQMILIHITIFSYFAHVVVFTIHSWGIQFSPISYFNKSRTEMVHQSSTYIRNCHGLVSYSVLIWPNHPISIGATILLGKGGTKKPELPPSRAHPDVQLQLQRHLRSQIGLMKNGASIMKNKTLWLVLIWFNWIIKNKKNVHGNYNTEINMINMDESFINTI